MPTLQIKTEGARPSLTQNILDLYASFHTGGAYDSKTDTGQDDVRNERVTSLQERTHTPKGFKIKMREQATEMLMAMDPRVVTTRMRTSIYGDHSSTKYASGG